MADDIRDLVEWYPLMPVTSDSALASATSALAYDILDMRIRTTYAAGDGIRARAMSGANMFGMPELLSLNSSSAAVRWYDYANGAYTTATLPVFTGVNTTGDPWGSYVIVSRGSMEMTYDDANSCVIVSSGGGTTSASVASTRLFIHPDCMEFMQTPPALTFYDRGAVSSIDGINGVDGRVSQYTAVASGIGLTDGPNTRLIMSGGVMTITGGEGLGTGVYTSAPYSDSSTAPLSASQGVGLRSINGFYDTVSIEGTPNITVSASLTATMTLRLSITSIFD